MKRYRGLIVGFCLAALPVAAYSEKFDFHNSGPYLDNVPRPVDFLGYELGTLHTHHFRIEDYFEALAASAPKRIRLASYGESYEKKQLFIAVITSEQNLAKIEEIRQTNLSLADPRQTSPSQAAEIASEAPVVVWLDYGNDGNETANVEAAMQTAYQLVAGESDEMQRFRREAIVIVGPDHNPESHDRHVAWYNAFGVGNPEPLAMEHYAPWGMSTNNNHYQIDLNRDAWALTQQENQAIALEILRWRPQVFIDHHGQTENYFFPPPVLPINPSLPKSHLRWFEEFGRGNARAFDAQGWQYYVRDIFDFFFTGYWDTWPALHGAIGMTYETDGGGARGLAWRRRDGSIVTFRDGIAHHFTASVATVRTAVENREALLRDFYSFFSDAMEQGRRGDPARAFLLDAKQDPRLSAALVATLLRHGVTVDRVLAPFKLEVTDQETGTTSTVDFAAGTYLVDMAQPEKRVAETYLALEAPMEPEFVERQFERWSRNARRGKRSSREYYEFYDITSWSLPPAFGIQSWTSATLPRVETETVVASPERLVGPGSWKTEIPFEFPGLAAGVSSHISSLDGKAEPASAGVRAASGYLFRPGSEGAMRLVAGLLREKYRVGVSLRPLEVGSESFPRGTFVLRVSRNPERLHLRLPELAREAGVEVVASDTAFAASAQTGIGSNPVVALKRPRIAMVADEGVRITEYGAAWFTLEQRLGYPFTPIRFAQLARADLNEFDVIVLPEGKVTSYRRALGEDGIARLESWIEGGGTLVTWGAGGSELVMEADWVSASFADDEESDQNGGANEAKSKRIAEIDSLSGEVAQRAPVASPSADPDRPEWIPGALFRAKLDPTHWLTLGLSRESLPVLVRGKRFPTLSTEGDNPVVFPTDEDFHIAGFTWPGNSEKWLAGTSWVIVEPKKRGQVVLFAQDPNYRLTWRSTSRLFANALLLGPSLTTRKSEDY